MLGDEEETLTQDEVAPPLEDDGFDPLPDLPQKSTDYTPEDPRLMNSLFGVESNNNPNAVGPVTYTGESAIGEGQIMPATFKQYAKEGEDIVKDSKVVSQRVLNDYYGQFKDIKLALAAYNAGPGTIKKYQDRTPNGTWDEVSAEMEKNNAYQETRDYVPKILGRYEKALGTQSPGLQTGPPQQLGALPQGRGTRKEFADTLLQEVSKPDFDTLDAPSQIKQVASIYSGRKWEPEAYDTLKKTATSIWETANPEDQPNFSEIVGVPPITPNGVDVNKSVEAWKTDAVQTVIKSGVSPALFGDQFDEYLNQSAQNEVEAYTARNRSTVGWALNRAGNYVREGTKGAVGIVTGAVSGAVRLGGAPFGAGQETADFIENAPAMVLGVPARDFIYNTDENGELVLNPDGTPQTHWQGQVAAGIGMIGGTIASLGTANALGVSGKVLAAANISTNTLNMAGSSFKHVYNETGSLSKAYSAAAFSLPAAAVQSISELGVVAGAFSPTLKGLSAYDKARFIAQSFTRNAAIGGATTAAADLIQQYGETKQTGEEISTERTLIATATGTIGAGVAGAGFDYIRGVSNIKPKVSSNEITNSAKELADFRNSLETSKTIPIKPESISKSEADLLGVEVTPTEGGVVLNKKTDIALKDTYTPEELPSLLETLDSQPTPNELKGIAEEHAKLSENDTKTPAETDYTQKLGRTLEQASRPEYQNNIKAVENKVAQVLESDPGLLPVRRDVTNHMWEHVETGKRAEFLKDLLKPEKAPEFTNDVSDVSHIRILDEDAMQAAQAKPPKALATEENLNLERNLDKVNTELLDLKSKKEAIPKEDTEGRKAVQQEINAKSQEKRGIQANKLKLKGALDIELAEKETFAESQKAAAKDLKRINKVREKGLGAIVTSKGKSEIIIPKGLAPEVKAQVTAHEIAHAITDKLNLSDDVNLAVENKLFELRAKGTLDPASEVAKEVFLPEIHKNVKIPEGKKVKELEKESQEALLSKREFLANQVGALMLKRAGKDIGEYKILPEIEEALSRTKLPEIGVKNEPKVIESQSTESSKLSAEDAGNLRQLRNRAYNLKKELKDMTEEEANKPLGDSNYTEKTAREAQLSKLESKLQVLENKLGSPKPVEIARALGEDLSKYGNEPKETVTTAEESTQEVQNVTQENVPVNNVSKTGEVIPAEPQLPIKTGKQGETAFSKTVRESVPERPATEYEKVSRIKGAEEAKKYVDAKGTDETLKLLQDKEAFSTNPENRILVTDALLNKVKDEFSANPTPENASKLYEADQLRGAVGTSAAQQLALLQRFRNTDSFADFITQVGKAYKEAGFDAPEFTEFQLKELKAMYESAQGIPEGVLRNDRVQKMWESAMENQGIKWPEFIRSYMQSNLLSGVGTSIINTAGGSWMGPVFTALSHPFLGRGLIWKTMWNVLGVSKANAQRVLEGKGGSELFGGLIDPSVLTTKDNSTYAKTLASVYNKFGLGLRRVLSASDTFMRTTAGEGYTAVKKYQELSEKYADNPDKFYAEAAKIPLSKDALKSAVLQAEREGKALGLEFSEADKMVRAYEIIRRADTSQTILEKAADWADVTSLRGTLANPIQDLLHKALYNSQIWETHPLMAASKNVILPFGRALLKISDFAQDFVPGNAVLEKGTRYVANQVRKLGGAEPLPGRSEVLQDRLRAGQYITTALAVSTLGLLRSGAIQITGEEEKVLGEGKGKAAATRKEFRESEQKGVPPYSIIFPGGFALSYKDLPGLNAVLYGVHRANKAIDEGKAMPYVASEFFLRSYTSAAPFLGTGTLNSPYISLVQGILDPEVTEGRLRGSLTKFAGSMSKMLTPASSLLNDVKKAYDDTPEEANQNFTTSLFKDIPGVSEYLGSKPALNRFGEPVQRTALERVPGVGRIVEEVKVPSDEVAKKLIEKGIIVPELGRTIKFNKSDFPSEGFKEKYAATREERVGKMYSNALTPDEWYGFIKATGPYIKSAANQIASSNIPTDKAQELLIKRTRAIEEQARKRFIRTGEF